MIFKFDIFRVETTGVLWLEAVASLDEAETRVKQLSKGNPTEFLILDQRTGSRHLIKFDGVNA
jgi:hypothetical protein